MQQKIPEFFPVKSGYSDRPKHPAFDCNTAHRVRIALAAYSGSKTTGFVPVSPGSTHSPLLRRPNDSQIRHLENSLTSLEYVDPNAENIILSPSTLPSPNKFIGSEQSQRDPLCHKLLAQFREYLLTLARLFSQGSPPSNSDSTFQEERPLNNWLNSLKRDLEEAGQRSSQIERIRMAGVKRKRPENSTSHYPNPLLRSKIIEMYKDKRNTYLQIAAACSCSFYAVQYTIRTYKSHGFFGFPSVSPRPPRQLIFPSDLTRIREFIQHHHGRVTGKLVRNFVNDNLGIKIALSTAYHIIHSRLGLSRRKLGPPVPLKNSINHKIARLAFAANYLSFTSEGYDAVSIDEFGVIDSELPRFAWVNPGESPKKLTSCLRVRVNFIIAISNSGIIAIESHTSTTSQIHFILFIQSLVDLLHQRSQVSGRKFFIHLDNCRVHLTPYVRALISTSKLPFLFNIPYLCPANSVEYCINFLKKSISSGIHTSPYFSLVSRNNPLP